MARKELGLIERLLVEVEDATWVGENAAVTRMLPSEKRGDGVHLLHEAASIVSLPPKACLSPDLRSGLVGLSLTTTIFELEGSVVRCSRFKGALLNGPPPGIDHADR